MAQQGGRRNNSGRKVGGKNSSNITFEMDLKPLKELKKNLKQLARYQVKWGFINEKKYVAKLDKWRFGIPVAQIAHTHEYGNPAAKIPPRPFFANSLSETIMVSEGYAKEAFKIAMLGGDVKAYLQVVGDNLAASVANSARTLTTPALKTMTIRLKGNAKMLEETGWMLKNITAKVVRINVS